MRNSFKKINNKWILLFLFGFLSVTSQAQYDEGGDIYDLVADAWDATPEGTDSTWTSNDDGGFDLVSTSSTDDVDDDSNESSDSSNDNSTTDSEDKVLYWTDPGSGFPMMYDGDGRTYADYNGTPGFQKEEVVNYEPTGSSSSGGSSSGSSDDTSHSGGDSSGSSSSDSDSDSNSNDDLYDPYGSYEPIDNWGEDDQYPPDDSLSSDDSVDTTDSTLSSTSFCKGCPPKKREWYFDKDKDSWHSEICFSDKKPGDGWKEGKSKGLDCDDDNPFVRQCYIPITSPALVETVPLDVFTPVYAYGRVIDNIVYIRSEDGTYKKPSQLNPSSFYDRKALNEFAASLARNLDGLNKNIIIASDDFEELSSEVPALTHNGNYVVLNSNGGYSKSLDNVNNFKSILKHEIFHVDDDKIPDFVSSLSTHADVYIKAANHATYKNTTKKFRSENAASFARYLLNMDKTVGKFNPTEIIDKITEFNKNTADVEIVWEHMMFTKGNLWLTIKVDGLESGVIIYKKIDE